MASPVVGQKRPAEAHLLDQHISKYARHLGVHTTSSIERQTLAQQQAASQTNATSSGPASKDHHLALGRAHLPSAGPSGTGPKGLRTVLPAKQRQDVVQSLTLGSPPPISPDACSPSPGSHRTSCIDLTSESSSEDDADVALHAQLGPEQAEAAAKASGLVARQAATVDQGPVQKLHSHTVHCTQAQEPTLGSQPVGLPALSLHRKASHAQAAQPVPTGSPTSSASLAASQPALARAVQPAPITDSPQHPPTPVAAPAAERAPAELPAHRGPRLPGGNRRLISSTAMPSLPGKPMLPASLAQTRQQHDSSVPEQEPVAGNAASTHLLRATAAVLGTLWQHRPAATAQGAPSVLPHASAHTRVQQGKHSNTVCLCKTLISGHLINKACAAFMT